MIRETRTFLWQLSVVAYLATSLLLGIRPLRAEEGSSPSGKPLESFAVLKHGDLLIVPLEVGQRKISCWVDTGSSHIFFDTPLRPLLGASLESAQLRTTGVDLKISTYRAPLARLGKIELNRREPVGCMDLTGYRIGMGLDFQAVVGMAALKEHIVRIDFDHGTLDILPADAEADSSWGEPIPLRSHKSGLGYFVTMSVAGEERSFLLDTGAIRSSISESDSTELLRKGEVRRIPLATAARDGEEVAAYVAIPKISVGPFTHEQAVFWESRDTKLGLDYLSRFHVVLDFPNRTMYLKPAERYALPDHIDMSGLEPGRLNGETAVRRVLKAGPAERAGLRSWDMLKQLNGRDVSSYSLFELRELFASGDKKQIPITYSRDGQKRQTTLVLSDPTLSPPATPPAAGGVQRSLSR
jgi:predicted aspartyl protease